MLAPRPLFVTPPVSLGAKGVDGDTMTASVRIRVRRKEPPPSSAVSIYKALKRLRRKENGKGAL